MVEKTNLASKVTVKALNLNPAEEIKSMAMDEVRVIGRIFGLAQGYRVQASKFADQNGVPRDEVKFRGDFEGTNLLTGETVNSNIAYMPNEVATEKLRGALDTLGDSGGAVQFGMEIAIRKIKRKDGTDGYSYGIAIPKVPEAADPLAAMRDMMGALPTKVTPAQIEAPKPAATPPAAKK